MLWFFSALLSAVLWGLNYAVAEHALKNGIPAVVQLALYAFVSLPVYGVLVWRSSAIRDTVAVLQGNPALWAWMVLIMLSGITANIFMYWAIREKDATTASLIEISYPVFIAFFAWAIFRTNQLSLATVLGGAFILTGVAIIFIGGRNAQ